jgi:CRP-like cAMP-binding protein
LPDPELEEIMSTSGLTSHELFKHLRPDQMDAVSDVAEEIELANGEIVFHQGDPAEYFYVVLEGQVELSLPAVSGLSLQIDQALPGTVFGSCMCVQRDAYALTAHCLQHTRLVKIEASTLKGLMDNDSLLGYTILGFVSKVYFSRYIDTTSKLQSIVQSIPLASD